jgi:hypothetical protein
MVEIKDRALFADVASLVGIGLVADCIATSTVVK